MHENEELSGGEFGADPDPYKMDDGHWLRSSKLAPTGGGNFGQPLLTQVSLGIIPWMAGIYPLAASAILVLQQRHTMERNRE